MGAVARGWYVDGISSTSSIDDAFAANNIGSGRIIGGRTCGMAAKREPRCIWPAWTSRWSSTCQDQRPLRTIWAIKKFTDGLQRLHHVKWQASRVRRPSNMFTEVARLLAASASRAPKSSALAYNGNADHVRKKMGLHLETCQAGDHQICSFAWAHNFWTLSQSKTHLEQMMKELTEEAER